MSNATYEHWKSRLSIYRNKWDFGLPLIIHVLFQYQELVILFHSLASLSKLIGLV